MDKNGDARLERIKHLETQLCRAPIRSSRHRLLARAILIEAKLYRKSLDIAQAANRPARSPSRLSWAMVRGSASVKSRGLP